MGATHFTGPVTSTNGFVGELTVADPFTAIDTTTDTLTVNTSAAIGGGTAITKIIKGTIAVDLASITNGEVGEATLTITGAAVGDTVIMNPVAAGNTAGLIYGGARVSATNTVKLRVANLSAAPVDEASQTWDYCLIRA